MVPQHYECTVAAFLLSASSIPAVSTVAAGIFAASFAFLCIIPQTLQKSQNLPVSVAIHLASTDNLTRTTNRQHT